ncbi:hypothetical protein HMPREF9120_00779 [Neisseria sp. oral taxon 020 str. F0370]|nr:hypothetical protein HMPREF9120_00779 [Neisseria sp. oral taxon 020 str. F0370]
MFFQTASNPFFRSKTLTDRGKTRIIRRFRRHCPAKPNPAAAHKARLC